MSKVYDNTLKALKALGDCGSIDFDFDDIEGMIKEGKEQVDVEDVIIAVTDHNRKCLMDYADARFKEIEAEAESKKMEEVDTSDLDANFLKELTEFGFSEDVAESIVETVKKKAMEDAKKIKKTKDDVFMNLIKMLFE